MKAWLFTGAHEPLQLIERETPQPAADEVLVRVRAAGLCHSDVGAMDGTLTAALGKKPPLILGHEIAGVVEQVGPGVSKCKVGDRIVAWGHHEFAAGWTADGGYATHCLLPMQAVVPLPDTVGFVQGAAATDAGATAYGALVHFGELRAGMRVGIVGLGGLGMTGAQIAIIHGATVYAAEPRREVWETAKGHGVVQVVSDVRDLASHELDLIVDFAGFGVTTSGAIHAIRRGGTIVQVGVGRPEATIPIVDLVTKTVTLKGAIGGQPGSTQAVLRHMAEDGLVIEASTIGFDEIPAGLDKLEKGGVVGRIVAELA